MKIRYQISRGFAATTLLLVSTFALASEIDYRIEGMLTVPAMTQGQLLWLKGRVGEGEYQARNTRGELCQITVPVAVGLIDQTAGLDVADVTGLKIAIRSPELSRAILNGEPIRSEDWVFSYKGELKQSDGYIVEGVARDEGFVINARKRWISWLLDEERDAKCQLADL